MSEIENLCSLSWQMAEDRLSEQIGRERPIGLQNNCLFIDLENLRSFPTETLSTPDLRARDLERSPFLLLQYGETKPTSALWSWTVCHSGDSNRERHFLLSKRTGPVSGRDSLQREQH